MKDNASTSRPAVRMPAEWESQSCVMLTFPHAGTDWDFCLSDAIRVFSDIIRVVSHYEPVLLVCEDISLVRSQLHPDTDFSRLLFAEMPSNDTWARDHAPISVFADDTPVILDFRFNAWGLKFPADKDNLITRNLFFSYRSLFSPSVKYGNSLDIVLEGGSIESDGCGTIMTSSQCLLAPNRNEQFSQDELEEILKSRLGANEILWVNNGNIDGDDTDGHIDTLCRFCSPDSIAYVSPPDESDDYYYDFLMMENELKSFRTSSGAPYRLFPLPNVSYELDGEPLPATYANFLIINGAVLAPVYGLPQDDEALSVLRSAFPDREIIPVDCQTLIRQHGSLHCVTMQFPSGFILPPNK